MVIEAVEHLEVLWPTISTTTKHQGRIYYEANEASASGPHHLGGPHQNFNVVSKVDFLLRKKSLKVNLL